MLASIGISHVKIIAPMKVSVLCTGSELINPGTKLGEAQIYNSCSYVIASKLKRAGIKIVNIENCDDDIESIKNKVQKRQGLGTYILRPCLLIFINQLFQALLFMLSHILGIKHLNSMCRK